jgi:hypothetical protein
MSAPVDALAVLRDAANVLRYRLVTGAPVAIEVEEVRAAVAELIEEAETLLAGVMGGEGDILALDADDLAPLKAAIARCKGEQP